jgi:hypothetical protein
MLREKEQVEMRTKLARVVMGAVLAATVGGSALAATAGAATAAPRTVVWWGASHVERTVVRGSARAVVIAVTYRAATPLRDAHFSLHVAGLTTHPLVVRVASARAGVVHPLRFVMSLPPRVREGIFRGALRLESTHGYAAHGSVAVVIRVVGAHRQQAAPTAPQAAAPVTSTAVVRWTTPTPLSLPAIVRSGAATVDVVESATFVASGALSDVRVVGALGRSARVHGLWLTVTPLASTTVAANAPGTVTFTIHVPASAPRGIYRGGIRLRGVASDANGTHRVSRGFYFVFTVN